jgi:hypothetical protein
LPVGTGEQAVYREVRELPKKEATDELANFTIVR